MSGPMDGYRVVELTEGVSGPQTGLGLADAGAEVIKVERPDGDRTRGWGSTSIGTLGAAYRHLNRNKRSIALDPDSDAGAEIVRRLVRNADVVLADAGWSKNPLLEYAELKRLNPALVYCSFSLFGDQGPWANLPPYGELPVQLASEATATLGRIGEPPVRVANELAAGYAASHAVQAICAALFAVDEVGGQRIDMSLFGSMLAMRGSLWIAQSNPDEWFGWFLDSYVKPVNYGYRCNDGFIFMGLAGLGAEQRAQIFTDLGMDGWVQADPLWDVISRDNAGVGDRYSHEVQPIWERALAHFSMDEAIAIISRSGGSAFPKNTYARLLASPQAQHIGMVRAVEQSGGAPVPMQMPPWEFEGTPAEVRMGAPLLGEHGPAILGELGFESEEIAEFSRNDVLVAPIAH